MQPTLKEGPSILFSVLQNIKKPEIKGETRGIMDKKGHASWEVTDQMTGSKATRIDVV